MSLIRNARNQRATPFQRTSRAPLRATAAMTTAGYLGRDVDVPDDATAIQPRQRRAFDRPQSKEEGPGQLCAMQGNSGGDLVSPVSHRGTER
jgi:hypothetical protein